MQPPELEKGWINDSWESIAAPAHLKLAFPAAPGLSVFVPARCFLGFWDYSSPRTNPGAHSSPQAAAELTTSPSKNTFCCFPCTEHKETLPFPMSCSPLPINSPRTSVSPLRICCCRCLARGS